MEEPRNDNATGSTCLARRPPPPPGGAASAFWIALPAGCLSSAPAPSGPIAAGNVADVAVGSLRLVDGENVILGRDAGGLYAMTRVCTHAGQPVVIVGVGGGPSGGLRCNAHGSSFDGNGAVTQGPAGRPLQHYRVDVAADGAITIQGGVPVTSDVRMPVA
jgi:thiosulfate dehydrogenase [quinone] large subunit